MIVMFGAGSLRLGLTFNAAPIALVCLFSYLFTGEKDHTMPGKVGVSTKNELLSVARYDIVGHSGEDYRVEFVHSDRPPKDNKQRLQVLKVSPAIPNNGVIRIHTTRLKVES